MIIFVETNFWVGKKSSSLCTMNFSRNKEDIFLLQVIISSMIIIRSIIFDRVIIQQILFKSLRYTTQISVRKFLKICNKDGRRRRRQTRIKIRKIRAFFSSYFPANTPEEKHDSSFPPISVPGILRIDVSIIG